MLCVHIGHANFDFNGCSQKVVFSFEEGQNAPNYSSSGSNHLVIKSLPFNAILKILGLMVSKSDFTTSGPRSFPEMEEYEFAFEFVNLLLKIIGGNDSRPDFVIFVVLSAFFIGIHCMQDWTATTRHKVRRKRSAKRSKHTGNLFRKNLQEHFMVTCVTFRLEISLIILYNFFKLILFVSIFTSYVGPIVVYQNMLLEGSL